MASVATDSSGVEPMVPMVPEHAAAPSHEELLGAVLEQMEALTWTVASMDSRLQAVEERLSTVEQRRQSATCITPPDMQDIRPQALFQSIGPAGTENAMSDWLTAKVAALGLPDLGVAQPKSA